MLATHSYKVVLQRSSRKINTPWLVLGRTSSLRCYRSHSINLKIYCMSFKGGSCLKAAATHRFCGRLLSRWCFVQIPFTAYRERGCVVCYVRTCLFVISRVSGWMCVLDGRGCVCTSINEEHLKSPAGEVCLFDPLRLRAVLCSDAGIRGIIRG